jgi:hypothetical protein
MDIATAILALKADAQVKVDEEDIDRITWIDGNPTNITKQQILDKQAELKADYDAKQYQRDRAIAYKELKEQFDLLYHDMVADKGDKTGEWFKHIKAVKDANPKE